MLIIFIYMRPLINLKLLLGYNYKHKQNIKTNKSNQLKNKKIDN